MKLEEQVYSLELAKRLDELGVKQESLFYWVNPKLTKNNITQLLNENERFIEHHPNLYFSAFTATELLEMLPFAIEKKENEPFNFFRFNMTRSIIVLNNKMTLAFIINYHCDTHTPAEEMPFIPRTLFRNIWDTNLANALAKTLILLIDESLVKLEVSNKN